MSVEDLKKFGQLCGDDEIVRARAKEIGINDPDGLMAYAAKELDLEFNQDDMMDLAREAGFSQDELSEEDLEKIAGGVCSTTSIVAIAFLGLAAGLVSGVVVGGFVGGVAATTSDVW